MKAISALVSMSVCSLVCADSILLPAFELQGFASQVSASTPSVQVLKEKQS